MYRHPSYPDARLAACSVALSSDARPSQGALQIFPPGLIQASQGAVRGSGPWRIDAAAAAGVIRKALARGVKLAIDHNHQTLHAETNGQPAPAWGWIDPARLVWDEARGLIDPAPEWTAAAAAAIDRGEWRYGSPLFQYDPGTGTVLELINFSLHNTPAFDGFKAIGAAGALNPVGGLLPVDELLERLRYLLNVPITTTAEEMVAHLDKLKAMLSETPEATVAAGGVSLVQALTGLKAAAEQSRLAAAGAGVAASEVVLDLQSRLAALEAERIAAAGTALVEQGIADGRLLGDKLVAWARGQVALGAAGVAVLQGYMDHAQPIHALAGTQTGGKPPAALAAAGACTLSADEEAACAALGMSRADYLKARTEENA